MSAPFGCLNPHAAGGSRHLRYDPVKLLPGFESVADVQRRSDILIRPLRRSNAANARDLAERLAKCGRLAKGQREWCLSTSCPPCMRQMRRWYTNEIVTIAETCRFVGEPYGVVVTVVANGLTAPLGLLQGIELSKVQRRFWKAMKRLKIDGYPIVGGIDISHNLVSGSKQPGFYQVHLSFALLGYPDSKANCEALKELVQDAFRLEPTAHRAVVVNPVRDPVRQLSYLLKGTFQRRVSYIDDRGRRNTRTDLLVKLPQRVEIARWLDRSTFTDRLLLYGVRRVGSRLRVTSKSVSGD